MAFWQRLRARRRDVLVALVTSVVCIGVVAPLTLASTRPPRQYTIWPQNSARFANLDWNCEYVQAAPITSSGVVCGRESTAAGLRIIVSGDHVTVTRCARGNATNCKQLFKKARTP